jgi:putative restriction endonuclease
VSLQQFDTLPANASVQQDAQIRRGYITALTKRRIHQQAFRERVLTAYRQQCALCRLKHGALLDAAHIVPDSDPEGEPVTSNGIALCKLHHAAFDRHFLAVRSDYRVEIRSDVLEETDGPMLKHGLQGLHLQLITVPSDVASQPNREALESRYQRFLDLGRR